MTDAPWWRRGVVYEIYVRSFHDASGDGVGDLRGIAARLDYLAWLGVDAIWLTPFYRSPMRDFGYDIADYRDVDPLFGSLADFDLLVGAAHDRGIRVIVDFVPNHTSDQHPWFVESRSSRTGPRRDWYCWRDSAPDRGRPNNWVSMFGGPAWEWDEATGQHYLHMFLREQPDLNWRNPAVKEAMFDNARFWLDRGVDGFRIDVAGMVMKDPEYRDNPLRTDAPPRSWFGSEWMQFEHLNDTMHPDVFDVWRDFRRLVDEHGPGDRVTVAEVGNRPLERWARWYGANGDGVHMPFGFHLVRLDWDAAQLRSVIDAVEGVLPAGAWPNWVLGNHDQPRIASWVGPERARLAMMLLLTLRGSPTLYYGDELGMTDVPIPPERAQDPWEGNVAGQGRDPERTPMPWDATPNGGFCPPDVKPWLPLGPAGIGIDVASQRDDPCSMLALTRELLRLRRENDALAIGSYMPIDAAPDGCFAWIREHDGARIAVVLNLSSAPIDAPLPGRGRILISTGMDRDGRTDEPRTATVAPSEGLVVLLD
jgi:alpha-glucosidase